MDLLQLKYFESVARTQHMTKSASELHIAQPSLSKAIIRLEKEIGVPLFNREGRNILLNEYGQVFLRRVQRAFRELEAGKKEVRDLLAASNERIIIATDVILLLPDLLKQYSRQYPNVNVIQTVYPTEQMRKLLDNGGIDFCISSPMIDGPELECVELVEEELYIIVPPTHRLADREWVDLHELAGEPFVSMNKGHGFRDMTDQFCYESGFSPNVIFEGGGSLGIVGIVEAGLGISFIPQYVWHRLQNPAVKRVKIREPVCRRKIGLSRRKDRPMTPAMKHFEQTVIDFFSGLFN